MASHAYHPTVHGYTIYSPPHHPRSGMRRGKDGGIPNRSLVALLGFLSFIYRLPRNFGSVPRPSRFLPKLDLQEIRG